MSEGPQRDDRFYSTDTGDQRTPFQRDRDRILYSQEFRRLSGVTQVARADESYLYHDRLSHSLKVAQVGRRLAEHLIRENEDEIDIENYLDPDVVETAALAHDLGHPPYGHVVEQELDSIIKDRGIDDGFEGNPQSFRIVTQTATHKKTHPGLNLTRASLNAILKYPWARGDQGRFNKWGYYESEEDYFRFARELSRRDEQSLEAEIMDWADDLTYGIHDVTDFYQSGLIPLDQLLEGTKERDQFIEELYNETSLSVNDINVDQFFDDLRYIAQDELLTPFGGAETERSSLKNFSSALVERFLGINREEDVELKITEDTPNLDVDDRLEAEIEILKFAPIYYVIEDSTLMAQQRGQRKIVRELFEIMMENSGTSPRFSNIIPSPYRERLDAIDEGADERYRIRIVSDLISSMTEQQASRLYQRLTGHSAGSLQDRIMR